MLSEMVMFVLGCAIAAQGTQQVAQDSSSVVQIQQTQPAVDPFRVAVSDDVVIESMDWIEQPGDERRVRVPTADERLRATLDATEIKLYVQSCQLTDATAAPGLVAAEPVLEVIEQDTTPGLHKWLSGTLVWRVRLTVSDRSQSGWAARFQRVEAWDVVVRADDDSKYIEVRSVRPIEYRGLTGVDGPASLRVDEKGRGPAPCYLSAPKLDGPPKFGDIARSVLTKPCPLPLGGTCAVATAREVRFLPVTWKRPREEAYHPEGKVAPVFKPGDEDNRRAISKHLSELQVRQWYEDTQVWVVMFRGIDCGRKLPETPHDLLEWQGAASFNVFALRATGEELIHEREPMPVFRQRGYVALKEAAILPALRRGRESNQAPR